MTLAQEAIRFSFGAESSTVSSSAGTDLAYKNPWPRSHLS